MTGVDTASDYLSLVRKHVVIIGTSFIGMEVAAALIDHAASVTVIGRDRVPFQVSHLIFSSHSE